jgi:hypothetical protein
VEVIRQIPENKLFESREAPIYCLQNYDKLRINLGISKPERYSYRTPFSESFLLQRHFQNKIGHTLLSNKNPLVPRYSADELFQLRLMDLLEQREV